MIHPSFKTNVDQLQFISVSSSSLWSYFLFHAFILLDFLCLFLQLWMIVRLFSPVLFLPMIQLVLSRIIFIGPCIHLVCRASGDLSHARRVSVCLHVSPSVAELPSFFSASVSYVS